MAGIKISELPLADALALGNIMEIVQGGVSKRIDASTISNVVAGIGNAAPIIYLPTQPINYDTYFSIGERLGTIYLIFGSNDEQILASAPDAGVLGTDLVNYVLFNMGSSTNQVQLVFSTTQEQIHVRYNLVGTWSAWSEVGSDIDIGVSSIVAGTNVTISPVGGTGAVTINAAGGGGGGSANLDPVNYSITKEIDFRAGGAAGIKKPVDIGNDYMFLLQVLEADGGFILPDAIFGVVVSTTGGWYGIQGGQLLVQNGAVGTGSVSACKLSDQKFALYRGDIGWAAYTYERVNDFSTDFETQGLVTLISNPVSFPTPALANSDWVSLTHLFNDDQFAVYDSTTKNLQRMFFDGFDFSADGAPLNLPLATGEVEIEALNSDSIALYSPNEEMLYYITYNGATWVIESSLFLNNGDIRPCGLAAVGELPDIQGGQLIDVFLAMPSKELVNYRLVNGTFAQNGVVQYFDTLPPSFRFIIASVANGRKLLRYDDYSTRFKAGAISYDIGEGYFNAEADVITDIDPRGSSKTDADAFLSNKPITANVYNRLGDFGVQFIYGKNAYFAESNWVGQGLVYQHPISAYFNVTVRSSAFLQTLSVMPAFLALGINGLPLEVTREKVELTNVGGTFPVFKARVLLNHFDDITAWLYPAFSDVLLEPSLYISAEFDGFLPDDRPNLQEELFENPNLLNNVQGLSQIGLSSVVASGKIEYTSTTTSGVLRIHVLGLEIDQRYRIAIPCSSLEPTFVPILSSSTFGVLEPQEIRENDFTPHTVDLVATATGGYIEFTFDNQIGTSMALYAGISIKAYL